MKKLTENLIYSFLIMGFVLIFSYGCKKDDKDVNPQPPGITVTDIDGNVYHAVTIGTQVWMAENLKTTRYRNGDSIPNVTDSLQWISLTTPGFCNCNNDVSMTSIYGRLYNWYAVTDSNNIAPVGWHVPNDAEWDTLTTYLGAGPGGKLKAIGTTYWSSPNTGATNETGFNGLPAGDRNNLAQFNYMGTYACFWCTTEYSPTEGIEHVLSKNSTNVIRMNFAKSLGISVRCVKD
jgi:uncharacterized protein (TIGR02145 family)